MSATSNPCPPPVAEPTPLRSRKLPAYLQPPHLSVAELAAARLDGELFAFEDGYCSVDEPDTVRLRSDVLASLPGLKHSAIAELSAAWLHGAILLAPRIHTGYVTTTGRTANAPRLRLRQVGLRHDDTESCGGLTVTTPTRTVADLARRIGPDAAPALEAIRGLFLLRLTSPGEVIAWIEARQRVIGGSRIRRVVESATEITLAGLEPSRSDLESWALPLSRR